MLCEFVLIRVKTGLEEVARLEKAVPLSHLCVSFSGATRGSVLPSVPGLRAWTEAGGPGPCGGRAAGPVVVVCHPPGGTVTAQRK